MPQAVQIKAGMVLSLPVGAVYHPYEAIRRARVDRLGVRRVAPGLGAGLGTVLLGDVSP